MHSSSPLGQLEGEALDDPDGLQAALVIVLQEVHCGGIQPAICHSRGENLGKVAPGSPWDSRLLSKVP